jgi:hypothetical protein
MAKTALFKARKCPNLNYKHSDELFNIYYHLKKFLFLVMAVILDTGRRWQTLFWKGTTLGSFQQSLAEIGSVVSEEKIF